MKQYLICSGKFKFSSLTTSSKPPNQESIENTKDLIERLKFFQAAQRLQKLHWKGWNWKDGFCKKDMKPCLLIHQFQRRSNRVKLKTWIITWLIFCKNVARLTQEFHWTIHVRNWMETKVAKRSRLIQRMGIFAEFIHFWLWDFFMYSSSSSSICAQMDELKIGTTELHQEMFETSRVHQIPLSVWTFASLELQEPNYETHSHLHHVSSHFYGE